MDQNQLTQAQHVKVTSSSPFHRPLEATYQGEAVKVTHVGDAEEMSPVCLVIDSKGQSSWVRQSDVRFTDDELTRDSSSAGSRQKAVPAGR